MACKARKTRLSVRLETHLTHVRTALVMLFLAPGAALATNGPKLVSYGSRAAGRAGVDYAYADDGTGPATNPAGMAFVKGNRLDNNWAVIFPNVTWSNQFGTFDDRDVPFIPVPAFSFGAFFDPNKDWEVGNLFRLGTWGRTKEEREAARREAEEEAAARGETLEQPPILSDEEETFGHRIRFGFGVFPVTGGRVQIRDMRTAGLSTPVDWETDTITVAVTPSLAVRLNEYVAIGLSAQVIYSRFELDGGIAQPSFLLRDDFETAQNILSVNRQIITEADLDDAFTYGGSWRVGLMINPADWLSIGLIYQDRTYTADYLGRATVNANDEVARLTNGNPALLQVVDPAINPGQGFVSEYDLRIQDYEFPRMAGLGFAFHLPRISIGMDYTFINWDMLRTFKVRLSGGNNPNLDIMTSPTIRVRVPLRLKDQHVIALGVSVLALEGAELVEGEPGWALTLRTGYNYAARAVPRRTTLPQLPIIAEHHVSAGFTFAWGPLVEITFAWEWALPAEIDVSFHEGDQVNLSNSKQEVDIMLFHLGLGVRF